MVHGRYGPAAMAGIMLKEHFVEAVSALRQVNPRASEYSQYSRSIQPLQSHDGLVLAGYPCTLRVRCAALCQRKLPLRMYTVLQLLGSADPQRMSLPDLTGGLCAPPETGPRCGSLPAAPR
jgi:hypothetical protein